MIVVITDTGRVVNTLVELDREVGEDDIHKLEEHVNRHLVGLDLSGIRRERLRLYARPVAHSELLGEVVDTIVRIFTEEQQDRVFLGGTANILRQPEFGDPGRAMAVLDLVERGAELLALIGDAMDLDRVRVMIGEENVLPDTQDISVIATAYGVGDEAYGTVGLLGPTRMDYGRAISAVRCIADNLSRSLRALHS
jgi:heat-inducible transcriptional repressor